MRMKNSFWVVVVVLALATGILIGYSIWGPSAARLPDVENEVSGLQAQLAVIKKKDAAMEANLGKVANDKLNLEKENANLKDALAKAQKASQGRLFKRRR